MERHSFRKANHTGFRHAESDKEWAGLHSAILARRSVRRYAAVKLDGETLGEVRAIIKMAEPLSRHNEHHVLLHTVAAGENLTEIAGAYGRIMNPPHYLVPYVIGSDAPLVDAGFRAEEVVVRLTEMGLGTCFVGALRHQARIKEHFKLPGEAVVGALVAFGYPSQTMAGRGLNRLFKSGTGSTNKLPARQLFYLNGFAGACEPPPSVRHLIEAGRHAPSAVNAQPWRFLYLSETKRLYTLVKRVNGRYGRGVGESYRYHDGGTAMANIALAALARGELLSWTLLGPTDYDGPACPPEIEPLAVAQL